MWRLPPSPLWVSIITVLVHLGVILAVEIYKITLCKSWRFRYCCTRWKQNIKSTCSIYWRHNETNWFLLTRCWHWVRLWDQRSCWFIPTRGCHWVNQVRLYYNQLLIIILCEAWLCLDTETSQITQLSSCSWWALCVCRKSSWMWKIVKRSSSWIYLVILPSIW